MKFYQARHVIIILALSALSFTAHACTNAAEKPPYTGTYNLHFSAMRSFVHRNKPELSQKNSGPLDITVTTNDNGTQTITFSRCRIFMEPDRESHHAAIVPGAHTNTCILDMGGRIGETAVAFYNGTAEYSRNKSMGLTLYGTTSPVEEGGPEGTVVFTFTGTMRK
ncbi:MAG TPA: hypothetical protein PK544_00870 [Spirochaetota bacterium]|nr:hypothetical protein [Spirochaetota bacterium]